LVEARNTTTIIEICRNVRDDIVDLVEQYEDAFGVGPVWITRVPARLCLIGDHTDYWKGFTPELVTMASDSQEMWGVIGARDDGLISCISSDDKFPSWEEKLSSHLPKNEDWLGWLESIGTPQPHWSNYVMGSVKYTQMKMNVINGFNMYVSSTIPPASGSSSSSALATTAMLAIRLSNGLSINFDELVVETAEAEWYCGTRGGMMDHATMLYANSSGVLKLTFEPFTHEIIKLPNSLSKYKFATIFTHPSEKGGDTMLSFNKLAIVAREIVHRLLPNNWQQNWREAANSLPHSITPDELLKMWPEDRGRLCLLYPSVFQDGAGIIKVADCFHFVMRELDRSKKLQFLLSQSECNPFNVAEIMNESWEDAGELYGIRTPEMDEVASKVRNIPGVLGLKVMGAGFGGNLIALLEEGGDLSSLGEEGVEICSSGEKASLFDISTLMPKLTKHPPLGAIILCGGKGSRMVEGGILTHKPLLTLNGVPSTQLVINNLLNSKLNFSQIIIVVPPDREQEYKKQLKGLQIKIITQPTALGTGNAVICAIKELDLSIEQVYVSFGTQPLVRKLTIESSLAHHLKTKVGFTLPTTLRDNPYAPLLRDENGEIVDSVETHLENAEMPTFGETNVGAYWVSRVALNDVLTSIHEEFYDEKKDNYNTVSGELGFPNEMVRGCLGLGLGVEGVPIADPEEVIGLKTPKNVDIIELQLNKRKFFWG